MKIVFINQYSLSISNPSTRSLTNQILDSEVLLVNVNWNKVAKWSRLLVLVGLLVWITYESYMHQFWGVGKHHQSMPYAHMAH